MSKIFVSIASYRDPELLPTLRDCIATADKPENLIFGICWQHSDEDKWDNLDEFKKDKRFRIIDIDHKESKGVCWARNKIGALYQEEEYYLQLDSHHRFIQGWDSKLKDMISYLQIQCYEKPILSAYLPAYFPDKDPNDRTQDVWFLNIDRFLPEGAVFLRPQGLDGWRDMKEPVRSRFLSAHFIFTLGKFVKEVPYDPYLYFHGEETSLAARAYTHGYDIFNPHRIYIWHEYTREGKKKHWDDHHTFNELDKSSYARFRKLFGMEGECTPCVIKSFGEFYFGKERTLEEYEKYAGLKFKTRQIHEETLQHRPAPIVGDYESGLRSKIKVCMDIYRGSLPEKDYDTFAIALLDKNGNDVYRQDADKNEIQGMINSEPNDQFIHVWREYESGELPYSWRVWPHSESKGWMERIENVIKYE
jgi:hypothetical protein